MTIVNYFYIWPGVGILVAIFLLYCKKLNNQQKTISILSSKESRNTVFRGNSKLKRVLAIFSFGTGILMLFFCLLRICFGEQKINMPQCGRAVLFALDISRSMIASDISPSRLEMAKIKIRSALKELGPERVGLLLFSSNAVLQCPFTSDFKTFISLLDQIDSSIVSSTSQTSITEAFLKAIDIFERSKLSSRILVMITDGEDFSRGSDDILDRAKKEKIALLALGVGTTKGAPVPVLDTAGKVVGHEKDERGIIILTKLDEEKLIKTVTHLGGVYKRLTYSDEDLGCVKDFVQQFEREHFEDASFTVRNETYPAFSLLACIFLLLEALVGL